MPGAARERREPARAMPMNSHEKEAVRAAALRRRSALGPECAAAASRTAQANLIGLPEFEAAGTVCCYLAMRGEVETGAVIDACLRAGKRVLVPAWDPRRCEYGLARLDASVRVAAGRAGVPEPVAPEWVWAGPDLFVVPGVAFDACGVRLGRGGGHYDRLLSSPCAAAAFRAGLAFQCQIVDRVPAGARDVPMDAVVTEAGIYRRQAINNGIAAAARLQGG